MHERHGAFMNEPTVLEKHDQSIDLKSSLHTCIRVEADLVKTGLFVHLAKQLHEIPTINSRKLAVDFQFCAGNYRYYL